MVVDLWVVVEHHQALGRVRGQGEFDSVSEVVDAGKDCHRLGLEQDRVQLWHRRTGLERHRDGSGQGQGHVHDGVVGAGEAERRDPIAGVDRIACQGVGESLYACPRLVVGQGVEAGLQLGDRAARGIGNELDGALAEGGPVGVAGHHGADHVGEQDAGAVECGGDGWIGLGGDELRVARGQLVESTL